MLHKLREGTQSSILQGFHLTGRLFHRLGHILDTLFFDESQQDDISLFIREQGNRLRQFLTLLGLQHRVRRVVVCADNGVAGIREAEKAAARFEAEGREVFVAQPEGDVSDFNDLMTPRGPQ